MPQLSLFIDLQNKQLVRGFNNSIQTSLPSVFQGDTLQLFLRFLNPNPAGSATVPYVDADESTATVEAAIGTIGGEPAGGTFTLEDPDATQTTAAISYNATAATVQAAIIAALTTNWSTAIVTGNPGGPWIVTNGVNAARSALVLNGTALTPASQGDVIVQQAGTGSEPAIQYFKLQLSPIAYQDAWTPNPAPTITVANVQTGGVSGSNSIQSVTLNNQPYNGTFALTFGGNTTAAIPYNAAPSAVQGALQALSSVGSGNCAVGGSIGAYQITFIGSKGGTPQAAITANAGGLVGPLALTGTFSLATVGIEEAVGEAPSITQTFEMRITPAGGYSQTVLQIPISIFNDLIPNAPAIPTPTPTYYTTAQANATFFMLSNVDTDATMAADSNTRVPSQAAVVSYVAAQIAESGGGGSITLGMNATDSGFLTLTGSVLDTAPIDPSVTAAVQQEVSTSISSGGYYPAGPGLVAYDVPAGGFAELGVVLPIGLVQEMQVQLWQASSILGYQININTLGYEPFTVIDSGGVFYYCNGIGTTAPLTDNSLDLLYSTGALLADSGGSLYSNLAAGEYLVSGGVGSPITGASGGGGGGSGNYLSPNSTTFIDGNGNVYYSNNLGIIADSYGSLRYADTDGAYGPLLTDIAGNLYFAYGGGILATQYGEINYANGDLLADNSGNLNCPGNLTVTGQITAGDVYPAGFAFIGSYGPTMTAISANTSTTLLATDGNGAGLAGVQPVSFVTVSKPSTGGTVTGSNTLGNELLEIEPAGTLATLTVYLEIADVLPEGTVKEIAFSQAVTALTVAASEAGGSSIKGSSMAAAAINASIAYKKTASLTWRRLY